MWRAEQHILAIYRASNVECMDVWKQFGAYCYLYAACLLMAKMITAGFVQSPSLEVLNSVLEGVKNAKNEYDISNLNMTFKSCYLGLSNKLETTEQSAILLDRFPAKFVDVESILKNSVPVSTYGKDIKPGGFGSIALGALFATSKTPAQVFVVSDRQFVKYAERHTYEEKERESFVEIDKAVGHFAPQKYQIWTIGDTQLTLTTWVNKVLYPLTNPTSDPTSFQWIQYMRKWKFCGAVFSLKVNTQIGFGFSYHTGFHAISVALCADDTWTITDSASGISLSLPIVPEVTQYTVSKRWGVQNPGQRSISYLKNILKKRSWRGWEIKKNEVDTTSEDSVHLITLHPQAIKNLQKKLKEAKAQNQNLSFVVLDDTVEEKEGLCAGDSIVLEGYTCYPVWTMTDPNILKDIENTEFWKYKQLENVTLAFEALMGLTNIRSYTLVLKPNLPDIPSPQIQLPEKDIQIEGIYKNIMFSKEKENIPEVFRTYVDYNKEKLKKSIRNLLNAGIYSEIEAGKTFEDLPTEDGTQWRHIDAETESRPHNESWARLVLALSSNHTKVDSGILKDLVPQVDPSHIVRLCSNESKKIFVQIVPKRTEEVKQYVQDYIDQTRGVEDRILNLLKMFENPVQKQGNEILESFRTLYNKKKKIRDISFAIQEKESIQHDLRSIYYKVLRSLLVAYYKLYDKEKKQLFLTNCDYLRMPSLIKEVISEVSDYRSLENSRSDKNRETREYLLRNFDSLSSYAEILESNVENESIDENTLEMVRTFLRRVNPFLTELKNKVNKVCNTDEPDYFKKEFYSDKPRQVPNIVPNSETIKVSLQIEKRKLSTNYETLSKSSLPDIKKRLLARPKTKEMNFVIPQSESNNLKCIVDTDVLSEEKSEKNKTTVVEFYPFRTVKLDNSITMVSLDNKISEQVVDNIQTVSESQIPSLSEVWRMVAGLQDTLFLAHYAHTGRRILVVPC